MFNNMYNQQNNGKMDITQNVKNLQGQPEINQQFYHHEQQQTYYNQNQSYIEGIYNYQQPEYLDQIYNYYKDPEVHENSNNYQQNENQQLNNIYQQNVYEYQSIPYQQVQEIPNMNQALYAYTNQNIIQEQFNSMPIDNQIQSIKKENILDTTTINMLKNIKSINIFKKLLSYLQEKTKLDVIKYNKCLQNKLSLSIDQYKKKVESI